MRKSFKSATTLLLSFALLFSIGTVSSSKPVSADPVVSTDWMVNGGYGVSLHWTSQSVPSGGGSPAAFCTAVDNFNVTTFANQLADAGASYVIFTIGHAQQYFPFPSAKLDSVISGRTCTRDLPADMYTAIVAKGINMVFYYPSIATSEDPAWQTASKWNVDAAYYAQLQYDLVTEIGNRYGSHLASWWVDNLQGSDVSRYNLSTYASALRAGNADRTISFNFRGQGTWGSTAGAGIEDYAGGESAGMLRLPSSRYSGEGATQWHTWTFLDDPNWVHISGGTTSPRYSDNKVILYAKSVMNAQGVLSLNTAPYQDTLISTNEMAQLSALKAAVRNNPGTTAVIDNADPGITYSAGWGDYIRTENHLETLKSTNTAAANAQYTFTGTAVSLYGPVGTDHGKADIYIDNVIDSTIDLYSATRNDIAKFYTKSGLSYGSHTVKIVARSDKNASASNYYVELDALEYQKGIKVDDQSASVTYSGSWSNTTGPLYYQGTGKFTTASTSYAQYTFTGTKINWYGVKGSDHGKADVYIDNVWQSTVDLYQTRWTSNTLLYTKTGLSNAAHTIKVVARNDKNTASSGYYVEVDSFEY